MKKIFKRIHLWLSVPAGIVIFLMCITGAVLVLQDEILQGTHPERYKVKNYASEPLPLDEIISIVNSNLENDSVTGMRVFPNPKRTYIATLASGQRAHAYIDPYTAEIKGYYNYRSGFFSSVTRLHRWLMFKNSALGKLITGISTICFVVILITGIVAWWPRKSAFKKIFFTMEFRKGGKRRLFDLHRVLGLYATVLLLLMALTGLMWSFQWYRSGVGKIFGIEASAGGHAGAHGGLGGVARPESPQGGHDANQGGSATTGVNQNRDAGRPAEAGQGRGQGRPEGAQGNRLPESSQGGRQAEGDSETRPSDGRSIPVTMEIRTPEASAENTIWWQDALETVRKELPDSKSIHISANKSISVLDKKAPHTRANDTYSYLPAEKKLEVVSKYGRDQGNYLMTWVFALHVGSWGGTFVKVLYFIAALIGASLPVTGYWLWLNRHKRKNNL